MRNILAVFLLLVCVVRSVQAAWVDPPQSIPFTYSGVTYTHIQQIEMNDPPDGKNVVAVYCPDHFTPRFEQNSFGYDIQLTYYTSPGTCLWQIHDGTSWNGLWQSLSNQIQVTARTYGLGTLFRSTRNLHYKNEAFSFNGNFGLYNVAANELLITASSFGGLRLNHLSFPLADQTAYTAEITSVMDRDTRDQGAMYRRNGEVTLFNGETGTAAQGCHCYSTGLACNARNFRVCNVPGYLKADGTPWNFTSTVNYIDRFVYYDGHPGYDYRAPAATPILAPADGTLCVATRAISKPKRSDVWRDETRCPLAAVPGSNTINWTNYHAFYILHGPLNINGVSDEYMTMFLHNHQLENTILSRIYTDGYASVSRLKPVATVGGWGPGGANHFAPHLHIEVYKRVNDVWNRVDPYGDGVNGILWQH